MPLSLSFKGGGESTFGFQRGEGGPILVKGGVHLEYIKFNEVRGKTYTN